MATDDNNATPLGVLMDAQVQAFRLMTTVPSRLATAALSGDAESYQRTAQMTTMGVYSVMNMNVKRYQEAWFRVFAQSVTPFARTYRSEG